VAGGKPAPHSALDSLGRGKPPLVTPTSSIAAIVTQRRCGIVFEPTLSGFEQKYQLLYEELLQGNPAQSAAASPARERS
jgi:hypothetical protein